MWEIFNHIHFLPDVGDKVFPVEQVHVYKENKVFGEENSEQLWFLGLRTSRAEPSFGQARVRLEVG